jgi:flagellar hook assembly protein FlgD
MIGQEVATLATGVVDAGYHSVTWNATNNHGSALPSGIYLYRFEATSITSGREFKEVRKMVLMK